MFYVYALRNATTGRLYTGYTSDLTQRIGQHNNGVTKSTKNRGMWELIYYERYATRAEAMRREGWLKTGKGRDAVRAAIRDRMPRAVSG